MSVKDQAKELKDWTLKEELIVKKFKFDAHLDGAEFAKLVSVYSEAVIHHAEIRIGYKEVTVGWTSHSEGKLTEKDIAGAMATDRLYKKIK